MTGYYDYKYSHTSSYIFETYRFIDSRSHLINIYYTYTPNFRIYDSKLEFRTFHRFFGEAKKLRPPFRHLLSNRVDTQISQNESSPVWCLES
jgi:hypothetical protein